MSHYEKLAREAQDEKIAQLLMEAEKKKVEEERLAIQRDLEFARKLQEEDQADRVKVERSRVDAEKERVAKAEQQRLLLEQQRLLKEQQKRVQEEKDLEVARQLSKEDERRTREVSEAEKARKIQAEWKDYCLEENRKKKLQQERDDEDLARRLQAQLTIQPVASSVRSSYPPVTYYNNNYNHSPTTADNVVNAHTQHIHRQFCGCTKTNSWDSNHVFKVHTAHCSCVSPYVGTYSNDGAIHQHSRKCCKKNHVHNVNCHCDYRSHVHTHACCNKFHAHNQYCHCTNK